MAFVEQFDADIVEKDFDVSVVAGQFLIEATDANSHEQVYFYAAHEDELTDPFNEDGVLSFDVALPSAGTYMVTVSRVDASGAVLIAKDGTIAQVSVSVTVTEPAVKKIAIPVSVAHRASL